MNRHIDQLSIKVIEQADQEAQQLRTSKYVRRIVEYCDKSIKTDYEKNL